MNATAGRIIGLGNRLRGDDAIGPLVAERAAASGRLPAGVEAVEAGGDPLVLLDLLASCRRAVIVDAAEMAAPPGTVRVLDGGAIPAGFRLHTSLHAVDLPDVLAMAGRLGVAPRVTLLAVQPAACGHTEALSPDVERRLSEITSLALKEVES
jgi:hydrogenase maturation protease